MTVNALAAYSQAYGDPRVNFWRSPRTWPNDTKDFVFAGKAILKLGPHLLGSKWVDAAPATELRWELPTSLSLFTQLEDIQRGVRLLERQRTKYTERRPAETILTPRPNVFPTDDEWEEAVALAKREFEASWQLYLLFFRVSDALANACLDGHICTATRAIDGGAFTPKDRDFWNGETVYRRFETCRVDEAAPFTSQVVKDGGSWLFMERASLETFIQGPSASPAPEPERVEAIEQATRRRRRPGRRPVHDWEAMAIEYSRLATSKSITEESTTSGIADTLLDWAAERWTSMPEKSTVEDKVREWRRFNIGAGN